MNPRSKASCQDQAAKTPSQQSGFGNKARSPEIPTAHTAVAPPSSKATYPAAQTGTPPAAHPPAPPPQAASQAHKPARQLAHKAVSSRKNPAQRAESPRNQPRLPHPAPAAKSPMAAHIRQAASEVPPRNSDKTDPRPAKPHTRASIPAPDRRARGSPRE